MQNICFKQCPPIVYYDGNLLIIVMDNVLFNRHIYVHSFRRLKYQQLSQFAKKIDRSI